MRAYASRTGTRRNLDALRLRGWGLLVSAYGDHRTEGFSDFMIDNGAWSAYQSGDPWDEARFIKVVDALGPAAQMIVVPDRVAHPESLALSLRWLPRLQQLGRHLLIPVQDGMTPDDLRPHLSDNVGLFVGGTTDWKWSSLRDAWGPLASELKCRLHVGRAGSARMISRCSAAGAYSFDTSGPSRYSAVLPRLDNARRQIPMFTAGVVTDAHG